MDTRTGQIYTPEEMEEQENLRKEFEGLIKRMEIPPTEKQMARKPPRVGRNEPCPCGSGKKFKHCCLTTEEDNHGA